MYPQVHELEITIAESNGDSALLTGRLDGLLESLGALFNQKEAAAFDLPVELIKWGFYPPLSTQHLADAPHMAQELP